MAETFKISSIERFVKSYKALHPRGSHQSQSRFVTIAIKLIDNKLAGAKQLRVYPGQYHQLTFGVQFYLNTLPLAGNRASILRAKAVLQSLL